MQPAIPGLIGLHADYVIAQLGAWKGNARTGVAPDCMHDIAARLSGTDIAAIAKWLASRPGMTAAAGARGGAQAAARLRRSDPVRMESP